MSKICVKCVLNKELGAFYKDKSKKDGLTSYCKDCQKTNSKKNGTDPEYQKQYYLKHRDRLTIRNKQNWIKNKDKYTITHKKWLANNKDRYLAFRRQYKKERKASNDIYRISENLRNRLYYALRAKSWKKSTHFLQYIGCSQTDLKRHLESQFKDNMSWENYGQWHIDHIKPLNSASNAEELYKLCHYTNLQPLWAEENIRKGDKLSA